MIRLALCVVLIIAAISPFRASADEQASEASCAAEETTPKVAACLEKILNASEVALASEFQRLRSAWQSRDAQDAMFKLVPALESSQDAWAAYRHSECSARVLSSGHGTGARAEHLRCMIEMSEQRRETLRRRWY